MTNVKRYIGLSLSFCVRDILAQKISIKEISCIVTSTRFTNLDDAVEYYYEPYWSKFGSKRDIKFVLNEIKGLIMQPRLNFKPEDHNGHMLSHGHWLDTVEGTVLKHLNTNL